MQSQDRISSLAALSLFMSAMELFVPRFLPFFRLGLANIPILMALSMDTPSLMLLAFLKGIGTSFISGNLLSIFAIISIMQSLASAAAMKAMKRVFGSHISVYGVSLTGAGVSTIIQIALASIYAGRGTFAFLPLMLALSAPASILTAYISKRIPEPRIEIQRAEEDSRTPRWMIALMAAAGLSMMMTESIAFLVPSVLLSFLLQRLSGRRIKLLPHLAMLLFMLISSLLTPHGKVLFSIFSFHVTDGSLIDAFSRSLRLSGGVALSQSFSASIRPGNGIIGRTISAFGMLLSSFKASEGSFTERIRTALSGECTEKQQKTTVYIPDFILIAVSLTITALCIADCIFF